jgi:LCP family protein required for cell wall assembly
LVVVMSLGLGVNWMGTAAYATQPQPEATAPAVAQVVAPQPLATNTPVPAAIPRTTATVAASAVITTPEATDDFIPLSGTVEALPTSSAFSPIVQVEPGDAPLMVQAPGTMNILLLGVDASADERMSRTDTLLIASINPDLPSVSLLSIARDTQVHIPNHTDDRINTAFELGYLRNYPGGGPAFLAAVLRKNFGIKIDHYVRIDFTGFVKSVDILGGVDVLAECELHDTFPDPTSPNGKVDLDVSPGKISLTGKQALMYARSRESTSDFDRARRQQKVLRSLLSKVKSSNMLGNALSLYQSIRPYIDTDFGLDAIPTFVDIIQRLDNLAIKNRVLTTPIVKPVTRRDGAMVLMPTDQIIPYIAEALSPPPGNRAQNRMQVEVENASGRPNMEAVAAERLAWEGFTASSVMLTTTKQARTQIFDFTTTAKGSPTARLSSIFYVTKSNIVIQPDPGSAVAARILLGEDYNSCPRTFSIAGDVPLAPNTQLIPTSTPQN